MTRRQRNRWPQKAEESRLDFIALADDIQQLADTVILALMDDEIEQAARQLAEIYKTAEKQKQLMRNAKDQTKDIE